MMKRYPVLLVLAMWLLAGCSVFGGQPTPTPLPFFRHTAEEVLAALNSAGLSVQGAQRDIIVGRDAPLTFSDRYTFVIDTVAPNGGQIVVFDNPNGLQEWQAWITSLQSSSSTRRDVIYTFVHNNILMQLNAGLLPDQAEAYHRALDAME
jgi:hypothetical protein